MTDHLPTFEDVAEAAARIDPYIHKTRVVGSRIINERLGAEVMFKCENQQRAGSFKARGAYNAILARIERGEVSAERGVLAYSTGNHAQAIALAASHAGVPATILMPEDAAKVKVEMARQYGPKVVFYDHTREDREVRAAEMAEELDLALIPPADDLDVVAGAGTAVRELLMEIGQVDAVVLPVGGGALIAGSSLVTKVFSPEASVWGVEPEKGDDARQSLEKGEIVSIDIPNTIADGARQRHLNKITFPIIQKHVKGITTASDGEIYESMQLVAHRLKLVTEPTGVLGMAGLMNLIEDGTLPRGSRVGVILSGGNVDLDSFAHCITANF